MANASVVTAQTDFSAGEVDVTLKRDHDNEILRKGARQMANWRLLNSKKPQNRSGRRALFLATGRTEEAQMAPSVVFFLNFGNGSLKVYTSTGVQAFSSTKKGDGATNLPWTLASVKSIVYARNGLSIYITYGDDVPNNVPQVLTWDGTTIGVGGWVLSTYAEDVANNQKRTIFYRLSQLGVTLTPSALTGAITLIASAAVFTASHVGTRQRYANRQVLITAFTSSTQVTATVQEALYPPAELTFASDPASVFQVGDIIRNLDAGLTAQAIIVSFPGANRIWAQNISGGILAITGGATPKPTIIGPHGSLDATASTNAIAPLATTVWDDEVMNAYRGYPRSVFFDQVRLGFCDFPALSSGIAWSFFNIPTDLYPDAITPLNAFFELAPNKAQVFYVVAGPESSEFVFTSSGIWYIAISATNPLKPGSVAFQLVSTDGVRQIQPRAVEEAIVFMTSQISVKAIMAIGAYYRPYKTYDVSELHNHLFNAPVAIAAPTQEGTFPERYVYVLNGDGTIAIGKYTIEQGALKGAPGWLPWSGNGTPSWIAALASDVIFTNSYAPNGIAPVTLVEILDDTRYLDASQKYNTQPTGLPIPGGGKGPLWWLPNGSVDLMDGPAGTRMMGTYRIDANGFLIPQGNAGENFASANLVCGQAWTATLEPFIPPVQPGQDMSQRMWPRRVQRVQCYVQNSSGFVMARLYSDESGPSLPAAGTIMKQRRIATWNVDEDPTQPPPLREQSYLDRPLGRSHDPRWAIIKDTPGPIAVLEITTEVTV